MKNKKMNKNSNADKEKKATTKEKVNSNNDIELDEKVDSSDNIEVNYKDNLDDNEEKENQEESNINENIDSDETNETNETNEANEVNEADEADETEDKDEDSQELVNEYKDKYIRLHAEFDNFRRRTAKEVLEIRSTASADLMKELLDVVDNFDRAFCDEHKSDDIETFRTGIDLIRGQLHTSLKESGLEIINPEGEEFDPNEQEAFMQQPSDEIAENYVVSVFQKGYKIKNKVLRTAKVIVSSGSAK